MARILLQVTTRRELSAPMELAQSPRPQRARCLRLSTSMKTRKKYRIRIKSSRVSFSFKCAQAENEKHSSQEIFKVVILKCSRKTHFGSGRENFSDKILNFPWNSWHDCIKLSGSPNNWAFVAGLLILTTLAAVCYLFYAQNSSSISHH